jgi:energy-coupling factor transport system ATP-binding protein
LLTGRPAPLRVIKGERDLAPLTSADHLTVRYGDVSALRNVSTSISRGEIVALMGRNGAGKSTLLNTMVGLRATSAGIVRTNGKDPRAIKSSELVHCVGLVPQDPGDLLEASTVAGECRSSDHDASVDPGTTRALLALLAPEVLDGTHPRDLSEGQRLLLALAIVLAARPPLLLLDEPTRGLDYPTKARLAKILRELAAGGHGIVLATHDVELAAEVATRVIVLAEGEIVADGPTAEVVLASPMFAPQVAKILAPENWLTVAEVRAAITGEASA